MKKLCIFLILLCLPTIWFNATANKTYAADDVVGINDNNFPDANFRQFVSEKYDTNSDGFLGQAELDAVTEIECERKEISSLKGIEYFTNVKTLILRLFQ